MAWCRPILILMLFGWFTPRVYAAPPSVLEVDKVWSGHPVGFALLTAPPFQYVAYYDAERRMTVAQRRLDSDRWSYQRLPSTLGWDSHNAVTLALDRAGQLHVAGNMHGTPLTYFRTTKVGDLATLTAAPMTGEREQRVTYPVFLKDRAGRLVFRYRDGGSGRGDDLCNVFDEATGKWARLLATPLTDGEGRRNAYCTPPLLGPDGFFHMAWVWRDTPDCATNHDLSYAKSADLARWLDSAGRELALPLTLRTGEIVDPVPPRGGLINPNVQVGFDTRARAILTYHKYDAAGDLQVYAARREDDGWTIVQVSDWRGYRWEFGGAGTVVMEVAVGAVEPIGDGRLLLSYRYPGGAGTWVLDEPTLRPIPGARAPARPAPRFPDAAWRVDAAFPGMGLRQADDAGAAEDGATYRLVWETLDANRDLPRPAPWPAPSALRLVRGELPK